LKSYKSPNTEQIPTQTEIHKLINSIWNKKELSDQWKESIIVAIYKKGDKTGHSNYCGISLLSTSYKILSRLPETRIHPNVVIQIVLEVKREDTWTP
jgi:hypothetical protein